MDVRGKITMIQDHVSIDVGEIKRTTMQYRKAKEQLVQRAKVLRWAMQTVVQQPLPFVLIGRLFVPRGEVDNAASDEITEEVSIFTHQL